MEAHFPDNDGQGSRLPRQERDTESGIDYFKARYASGPQGRFQSPDPTGMFVADPKNPQSWNLYAYVVNNPLKYVDPTGTDCQELTGDFAGTIVDDGQGDTCAVTNVGNGGSVTVFPDGTARDQGTTSMQADPNNATPWSKTCSARTLFSGAGSIAIDLIGLIPEAEGATKMFENTAGYQLARAAGNSAGYRGIVATQSGMKAFGHAKEGVGFISVAFGLGDTSVQGRISTGLTVVGFIPGLGTLAAGASIVNDAIKTGMAVARCP